MAMTKKTVENTGAFIVFLSSIWTNSMVSAPLFLSARVAPTGWTAKSPGRKAKF